MQEFNPNIADWIGSKNDWAYNMSPKPECSAGQVKTDIKVRVLPRSSRNQIIGSDDGVFRVKLTAPPVEGKANRALKEFLSKKLGVAKGSIEIVSGEWSRQKSVRIHGVFPEEIHRILES